MPLETDQRSSAKVWFANEFERLGKCISFGTRCGRLRFLARLAFDTAPWVQVWNGRWCQSLHNFPGSPRDIDRQVGLPDPMTSRSLLKLHIDFVDSGGRDGDRTKLANCAIIFRREVLNSAERSAVLIS
jgi:hypothetical protein